MRSRGSIHCLLSLLLLVTFLPSEARAEIVELKNLTQVILRERVRTYLSTPDARRHLTPIAEFVRLDAEQLTYESEAGVPRRLIWAYEARKSLGEAQQVAVETALRKMMVEVFGNHQGGLISDADRARVLAVSTFVVAPDRSPPHPGTRPNPNPMPSVSGEWKFYWAGCTYPPCGCGPPVLVYGYYYAPIETRQTVDVAGFRTSVERDSAVAASAPATRLQLPARIDAASLYARGVQYYWDGEYDFAIQLFTRAVSLKRNDSVIWYFKALTELTLGDREEAINSARRGAALDLINQGSQRRVSEALERVQGRDRTFLRSALDGSTSLEEALRIIEAPIR